MMVFLENLHFLRPYWLLALIPVIGLWLWLWYYREESESWFRYMDPVLAEHLKIKREKRTWLEPVRVVLVLWLLCVLSLAGPAWQREPSPFADDQAGLFIVLKVTESMMATDVQPTRLERARQKIADLLALRQGAATGLVVYSGSAHLVMPLTRDEDIINTMIEDMSPGLMPVSGDALAAAIEIANRQFQQSGVAGSILVIADTANAAAANTILAQDLSFPMQILAVQSSTATLDAGIRELADRISASVEILTIDTTDVQRLSGNADTRFAQVIDSRVGERWQDAGYYLLPFIMFCLLFWSRKGWVVK